MAGLTLPDPRDYQISLACPRPHQVTLLYSTEPGLPELRADAEAVIAHLDRAMLDGGSFQLDGGYPCPSCGPVPAWRVQLWDRIDPYTPLRELLTVPGPVPAVDHLSLLCKLQAGRVHPPCSSSTCDGHGSGAPCGLPCQCGCHEPYWAGGPLQHPGHPRPLGEAAQPGE